MGRGKIQLKRIENRTNRDVTFSKRRSGMLKKAHEISVLCDAQIALIIFSTRGKLFEYSTNTCMDAILERYDKYRCAERAVHINKSVPQEELCDEYGYLMGKVDALQRSQSHLSGEKFDTLDQKDLQQLEQQFETALKTIKSKINQLVLDSIDELERKEKSLLKQNTLLEKKIKESENSIKMLLQMNANDHSQTYASYYSPQTFQAKDSHPTINLKTYKTCSGDQDDFEELLLFG